MSDEVRHPAPVPPRGRRFLQYALSGVLTLLFLWVAFRGTDARALAAAIGGADYGWIGLMVVLLVLSHCARALRWRYLLEPIKHGIGLRNLFAGVMVGYLFNNLLPRAGELVRPYVIGKLEGISKSSAFGTIVVERIIDTVSFLCLVVLLPFIYSGPLLESFPWLREAGIAITAITAAGLAFLVLLMVRRDWTDRLLTLLARVVPAGIARRMERLVHSFLDGFLFLTRPANFAVILILSASVWGLYILMVYVAFFAFGLGNLGISAAVVVQAISSIGVAIPTPGATGSYHVFTSQSLVKLFGVEPALALSYAAVTHAAGYLSTSVLGLYYLLHDQIRTAEAFRETPGGGS